LRRCRHQLARSLTPGRYKEIVRGYAREVADHPATKRAPLMF
jgi:hypothetical protein